MVKNRLTIKHVSIWLDEDLIFVNGLVETSFSQFKEWAHAHEKELFEKHRLKSVLNRDGTILRQVDWGSFIEDLIDRGDI